MLQAALALVALLAQTPALPDDALFARPVGGLEATSSTSRTINATGQPFQKALRVIIGRDSPETNTTQLTIPNSAPIRRGDVLLASLYIRGRRSNGSTARIELLFERATSPWTKSLTFPAASPKDPAAWKRVSAPFIAVESYEPGEAMLSLRLAFGPQTLDLGGLTLVNYGSSRRLEDLVEQSAADSPLGTVRVSVDLKKTRQILRGFGGNFCQPRYGATQPLDAVGEYNLRNLNIAVARVGLPLEKWNPEPGIYHEDGPARACLLQMQQFNRRRIPLVVSVWEGPQWMLPGRPESMGRTLAPDKYDDCIEAIGRFLATARDKYGAHADYFSFNEADIGVNFRFTPAQIADFIRRAAPRFQQLGLKTKFLLGDTANGGGFVRYAPPLIKDSTLSAILGPVAFHCWDALSAPDSVYERIGAIGKQSGREIWCTEAGHDAQLWQTRDPWASWSNALRTAEAYEKTLRLTGASLMLYWTYQDNYPLVSKDGLRPYPVWQVMKQMQDVLRPGWQIATATPASGDLRALPAVSPTGRGFSVLLINPTGPGKAVLTGLTSSTKVTVITSDSSSQGRTMPLRVDRYGRLTVLLPARSVVTVHAPNS